MYLIVLAITASLFWRLRLKRYRNDSVSRSESAGSSMAPHPWLRLLSETASALCSISRGRRRVRALGRRGLPAARGG